MAKLTTILVLVSNVLLLLLALYGVYGAFWVLQPGSKPPEWTPLYGSQSYLASLRNYGYEATIDFGFLTYRMNYVAGEGKITGVSILDWTQLSLLLLAILDICVLLFFVKSKMSLRSSFQKAK